MLKFIVITIAALVFAYYMNEAFQGNL